MLYGDPTLLELVVDNLVRNAFTHGSDVQITTRPGRLVVSNAGAVIPPDRLNALVEPFRRGSSRLAPFGLLGCNETAIPGWTIAAGVGTATGAMQLINVRFRPAGTKDAGSKGAPILGLGMLEPGPAGLRVQARRTRKALNTILSIVIGLVTLFFGVALIDQLDLLESFQEARKFEMAAGLVLGVVPGMIAYSLLNKFLRGPRVDLLMPPTSLRILSAEADKITLRLASPELRGDVTAVASDPASAHALQAFTAQWLHQNTPRS